jgi:hypothetical protein
MRQTSYGHSPAPDRPGRGLQLLEAGQRVLAVEQLSCVDLWISLVQQIRGAEEVLAGDGKELGRVFGGVGVDGGLGVGVGVELAVEVVVGACMTLAQSLTRMSCAAAAGRWRRR